MELSHFLNKTVGSISFSDNFNDTIDYRDVPCRPYHQWKKIGFLELINIKEN